MIQLLVITYLGSDILSTISSENHWRWSIKCSTKICGGHMKSWVNSCYWHEHGHERTPVPQTHENSKAFPVFAEASNILLLADYNQGLLPSDTAHLTHLLLISATVINANMLFLTYWCISSAWECSPPDASWGLCVCHVFTVAPVRAIPKRWKLWQRFDSLGKKNKAHSFYLHKKFCL